MKKKIVTLALAAALVVSFTTVSFAEPTADDTEVETITKVYEFNAVDRDNLQYELEEALEQDGIEYELTDAKYEVTGDYKPKTIKRTLEVANLEDFEDQKVIEKKGVKYTAEEPQWEEIKTGELTTNEAHNYASQDAIPESLEIDGKTYNYTSSTKNDYSDTFTTTTVFTTTDPESPYYIINDKEVMLSESSPEWDGWQDELAGTLYSQLDENLGATGVSLDSIEWAGDFKEKDGVYTREAQISGTITGSYYTAVFSNVQTGVNTVYRSNITYLADNPEGYTVTAKVTATYTVKTLPVIEENTDNRSWLRKHLKEVVVAACAGIVIIAGLISIILAILKKKKKEEEDTKAAA